MCFRPAAMNVENVCPQCGKENFPGVRKCVDCGAELTGSSDAPAAPTAPSAAPAPGVPAAPKAPQAPKPN